MTARRTRRITAAALLGTGLSLGLVSPATADAPVPVAAAVIPLEPGSGCSFGLTISSTQGRLRTKEFFDADGTLVRLIEVGSGISYTVTNTGTDPDNPFPGKSITLRAGGAASQTVVQGGLRTVTATGHNGLIRFPSDVPSGPSSTVYTERIVYTVDTATGVFTLVSTTGRSVDLCAALAP